MASDSGKKEETTSAAEGATATGANDSCAREDAVSGENSSAENGAPANAPTESATSSSQETGTAQADESASGNCGADVSPEAEKAAEVRKDVEEGKPIPADLLEKVPFRTDFAQKVFIAAAIVILIAIGVTFHDTGSRENQAAQATFSTLAQPIINSCAEASGLRTSYGHPLYTLNARVKEADIFVEFLHGPLPSQKAESFGLLVCERLARAYVVKGYMARSITVHVYSRQENGAPRRYYGKAVYNGNLDDLVWENAPAL